MTRIAPKTSGSCTMRLTRKLPPERISGSKKPRTPAARNGIAVRKPREGTKRPQVSSARQSTRLKSLPSAPENTPSKKSSRYAPPSGTAGTEPTANIGPTPKISCVTKPAAMAEPRTPMSICGEKFFASSSKEKTRLAKGALKMAAKPAPAPAVRRNRSSARERPAAQLTPAPTQAPISTLGPPRPSDSPAPMPSTTLANLPKSTRAQRR